TMTEEKYGKNKIPEEYTIQDWGITYDELEPYYEKFEKMAGTSGEPNPLRPARTRDYPTPAMKSTPMLVKFVKAGKNVDLNPCRMTSANLSENYTNTDGQRLNHGQYSGICEKFGCEYGAKSTPNVTVVPTALETENFDFRT